MPPDRDDLLARLSRFERQFFPRYEQTYRNLVADGQRPKTLFIGCSDSRIVPYALMDCGPGELFIARNVGNLIPPWDMSAGFHGTAAAIEFAVLQLDVQNIVVCGHSHCGAIRGLYEPPPEEASHLNAWLDLARDAALPVQASPETLRRVEQRSVVLQLERLMTYPMVARRVQAGLLFLHAWYYVLEEGQVLILDAASGAFVPHSAIGRPVDTAEAAALDAAAARSASAETRVTEIDAAHWFRMPARTG
jgi:carbonic anhydrase